MASIASIPNNPDTPSYYSVYLGRWTNWSRGHVVGSTITLTRRDGTLLIAFVALFITIVGTSFWRIACYGLHRFFSTEAARDALYHQRQAVLRNSANGASGLGSLTEILYAWNRGKKTKHAYSRLLPLLAFTIISLASFAVASGFSSRISTALGNEILISSSRCGPVYPWEADNVTSFNVIQPYMAQMAAAVSIYVQRCYSNTSNPEECRTLVRQKLPVEVERNASCPFGGGICLKENQNIRVDSGLLDSHDDFGLNTPPSQRFLYRSVLQCAPLNTTNHQSQFNYSDDRVRESYVRYHLGENPGASTNFTYESSVRSRNQSFEERLVSSNPDYGISTFPALWYGGSFDNDYSLFRPIEELAMPHTDVFLFFLAAKEVVFVQETNDDWYSAYTPLGYGLYDSNGNRLENSYVQDGPASALGCTTQYQYCNPNLPYEKRCTPLGSVLDIADEWQAIVRNGTDSDLMEWLLSIRNTNLVRVQALVDVLGASSLTSRDKLRKGVQGPLADNQWQLDVENWFEMHLAAWQRLFVEVATGPADARVPVDVDHSNHTGDAFCKAQKIRSTAYINVSTLGLCIIFGVGGLVILVSYTLEPFMAWYQKRHRLDHYSRLEWGANGVLQLQRLAHEELGLGSWEDCDGDVPVTQRSGEYLGVLDVKDPTHPRLKAPPATFEEVAASDESSVEPKK